MMILERERELREGRIPCSSEGVSLKLHFGLFHYVSICSMYFCIVVSYNICIIVSLKLHFGLFHCVSLCGMYFCIIVSYNPTPRNALFVRWSVRPKRFLPPSNAHAHQSDL